jgi:hypothetical protein
MSGVISSPLGSLLRMHGNALSANVKGTLSLIDGSRLLKIIKDKEIPRLPLR